MAILEPWVFKKDFKKGIISLNTVEDEKVKLVRMATSKLDKAQWLIYMHYLIGKDGEIKYLTEMHKMIAANHKDYTRAFKLAGFKDITFLKQNLWSSCRGLFIATK